MSTTLTIVVWIAAISGCATANHRVPVRGELGGVPIKTTADSETARYYLESYLAGINDEPDLHARIDALHQRFADRMPDRFELAEISRDFSVDFGSLFLAQLIHVAEINRQTQKAFDAELAILRKAGRLSVDSKPLEVIFAPAWLYRDNLKSGASLMLPRTALRTAGLRCHLARLNQDGTVEQNAEILAATIRRLRSTGKEYMLVSVSKSGAETAMALGELLPREESAHVRAWINISGALRGTPLIESILESPEGAFITPMFWLNGWDTASLDTLIPDTRRPSFERARIPHDLMVINMVGIPLSGQLSEQGKEGFDYLAPYGPNDGVTLTVDTMVPGRPTIIGIGLDHYYETPELPMWAVAIYRVVANGLGVTGTVAPPADTGAIATADEAEAESTPAASAGRSLR